MTHFAAKSFTVAMGGKSTMCLEKGHSGADSRGRCYCCGEVIAPHHSEHMLLISDEATHVPRETSDALRNRQSFTSLKEIYDGIEPRTHRLVREAYEQMRAEGIEPFENTRDHYNPNAPGFPVLYMGPLP